MTCFSQKINWVTLSLRSFQVDTTGVLLFGCESFSESQEHLRWTTKHKLKQGSCEFFFLFSFIWHSVLPAPWSTLAILAQTWTASFRCHSNNFLNINFDGQLPFFFKYHIATLRTIPVQNIDMTEHLMSLLLLVSKIRQICRPVSVGMAIDSLLALVLHQVASQR